MKLFVLSLFVDRTRDWMEHEIRSVEHLFQPMDGFLLLSILVSHRESFELSAQFDLVRK